MDNASFQHTTQAAPFPSQRPSGFSELDPPGLVFDPAVHLALEAPKWIKPLLTPKTTRQDDDPIKFPVAVHSSPGGYATTTTNKTVPYPGLAFTSSFRILSDEGVRAMRKVIALNQKYAKSNERIPKTLRGLGYRSKFVRDFTYSPDVLRHLSQMSGVPVLPHTMNMNIAQINFGQIGMAKKVDQWHLDSVPYVMVILLSDATDMQGGDLQVARLPDADIALKQLKNDAIDPSNIDVVNYPGPGHAIFMQGSRIAHGVTPVMFAREPRLTLVNSYQSANPFAEPKTAYRTFKVQDPLDTAPAEVGRHYAWRVRGKLDYILEKGLFDSDPIQMLKILDEAKDEIKLASDLIRGNTIDESPYVVDENSVEYKTQLKRRDETLQPQKKEAVKPVSKL